MPGRPPRMSNCVENGDDAAGDVPTAWYSVRLSFGLVSGPSPSTFQTPQPLGVIGLYPIDDAHLQQYAKAARTQAGFEHYLDEFVRTGRAARLRDRAAHR